MRLKRAPSMPHGIVWSIVAGGADPRRLAHLPRRAHPACRRPRRRGVSGGWPVERATRAGGSVPRPAARSARWRGRCTSGRSIGRRSCSVRPSATTSSITGRATPLASRWCAAAVGRGSGAARPRGRRCGSTSSCPRRRPLWHDDVGRATWWLGETWATALGALGVVAPDVHRGGIVTTPWSRLVCFAGLGPGEVTSGGRKVVGHQPAAHPRRRPLPVRRAAALGCGPARRPAAAARRRPGGAGVGARRRGRAGRGARRRRRGRLRRLAERLTRRQQRLDRTAVRMTTIEVVTKALHCCGGFRFT